MQQDDPLKLFVGGLPWALTSDDLREVSVPTCLREPVCISEPVHVTASTAAGVDLVRLHRRRLESLRTCNRLRLAVAAAAAAAVVVVKKHAWGRVHTSLWGACHVLCFYGALLSRKILPRQCPRGMSLAGWSGWAAEHGHLCKLWAIAVAHVVHDPTWDPLPCPMAP